MMVRSSTTYPTSPLSMTNEEWKARLSRSAQTLASWRWEAKLPWANPSLMRSIAEHEMDALAYYVPFMPIKLRAEVGPLIEGWSELRDALVAS